MTNNYDFLDSNAVYEAESGSDVKDNWDDESEDETPTVVKSAPKPKPVVKPKKPEPIEVVELTKEQRELKIKEGDREIAGDLFGNDFKADPIKSNAAVTTAVDSNSNNNINEISFDDIKSFEAVLGKLADCMNNTKIYELSLFTKTFGGFLKNALSQCDESKLHDLVQIIRNMKEEITKKSKSAKNKNKKGPTLKDAGTKLKGVQNTNYFDDFIDDDFGNNAGKTNNAAYLDEDDFM